MPLSFERPSGLGKKVQAMSLISWKDPLCDWLLWSFDQSDILTKVCSFSLYYTCSFFPSILQFVQTSLMFSIFVIWRGREVLKLSSLVPFCLTVLPWLCLFPLIFYYKQQKRKRNSTFNVLLDNLLSYISRCITNFAFYVTAWHNFSKLSATM